LNDLEAEDVCFIQQSGKAELDCYLGLGLRLITSVMGCAGKTEAVIALGVIIIEQVYCLCHGI